MAIRGFSGYYVSEDGRVFSDKSGEMKEMKYSYIESSSGLTYKSVSLLRNACVYRKYVHRLVYETYSGKDIKGKRLFFKDKDCFNCSYENLSDSFPPYILEDEESWLEGYEGRYTLYRGDVYSVWQRDHPKKLKPSSYFKEKKYTLYNSVGQAKTFYLKQQEGVMLETYP